MPITVGTTEDFNALWEFEKKKKIGLLMPAVLKLKWNGR